MANSRLSEIRKIRLEKLAKLREMGIDPFPTGFSLSKINISKALESQDKEVSVAGRIWKLREHGNVIFMDLRDESGQIQLLFQKKVLDKKFSILKLLDMGDFMGVKGNVTKTQAGEITIDVNYFEVLGKSIRPIPDDWSGLKDTEERYRKRYLDLLLDPEIKNKFIIRSTVLRETRNYLDSQGFVEVETPIFHPLYGGANAKPFLSHMNALDTDFYLRIAFELYLKRLVVGGYEKVYEIGRDFRNEGIDHSHSPEFTMLEWYESYTDYHGVMDRTEGLIKHLAQKIYGKAQMLVDENQIDIGKKWPRVCMTDILSDRLNLDVENLTLNELIKYCKENKIDLVKGESKGQIIFDIFDKKISKTLIEPMFVINYPQEVSPLSKPHRSKLGWVERFEGYIGGREICDGWSELTDPLVQRERFESDTKAARSDKEEAQQVDEDFLEAMEYGMPPIGGIGIGMDRLTMFFTNTWSIKEVILFPTLRPEHVK
ncbi:MAG: lysine--tRNA ligase [Patescibacteria group bacterium]